MFSVCGMVWICLFTRSIEQSWVLSTCGPACYFIYSYIRANRDHVCRTLTKDTDIEQDKTLTFHQCLSSHHSPSFFKMVLTFPRAVAHFQHAGESATIKRHGYMIMRDWAMWAEERYLDNKILVKSVPLLLFSQIAFKYTYIILRFPHIIF